MSRPRKTALLGALLVLCAFLFALPSLYLPGLTLLIVGPGAAAWVTLAARGARVDRVRAPARVEEGEPFGVTARASPGRWPLPAGTLAIRGLERVARAPMRRRVELSGEVTVERRGRRSIGPAALVIRDPLGLASRTVEGAAGEVLVLPRVEPLSLGSAGGAEGAGVMGGRAAAPEIELDSLRPPRPGTPASRIHWPTVARTGVLMERRLLPDSASRPLVVLDASSPRSEEALDRVVRAVASLCWALAVAGGCQVLLPGERRATHVGPELRGWPGVHARLALVGPAPPPPLRVSAATSAIFWVTARSDPPVALRRGPGAERFVVAPATDAPGRASFLVAGCEGRRVVRSQPRAA